MQINKPAFHPPMHLDNDQLEPIGSGCPLCGSNNRNIASILQADPEVLLLHCKQCHASCASRMPTTAALADYYGDYYQRSVSSTTDAHVTFYDSVRFGKYLAKECRPYLNVPHISILDFGGGDGSISRALAVQLFQGCVRSAHISVVDYDERLNLSQDSRISITSTRTLVDVSAVHDVVIASAVIEHVPNPSEILRGLLDHLKPGGLLYVRTPYVVPLMRVLGVIGLKWNFMYPAHLHDFGQRFWESYFADTGLGNGFQILKSKPSIVESTFKEYFLRTTAAYTFKAPWYIFGKSYKCVGGWEIIIRKNLQDG